VVGAIPEEIRLRFPQLARSMPRLCLARKINSNWGW
jgi:hypothetical protein